MTQITLELDDRDLIHKLNNLRSRLAAPRQLMQSVAVEMLSLTEKSFKRQGDPQRWKPLASATIKNRQRNPRKHGNWPGMILQSGKQGGLAATIQIKSTDTEAIIGSPKKYAAIHQFGGKAGKGRKVTIPARPYMPVRKKGTNQIELTPDARASILRMASHFIDQSAG